MIHFGTWKSSGTRDDVVCNARAWAELFDERDPTVAERVSFEEWLWDVKHEREFAAEVEIRFRFAEIPESKREALRSGIAPLTPPRYLPARRPWTSPRWAVAAAVILLGVGALWTGLSRQHYVTGIGEKLATHLADGSRVELSSQTELQSFGVGQCDRRVRLVRGEALFSVHRDPRCPFRVFVGRGSIEVLGTEFDVHQDGEGEERVSVLEGRVRLRGPSGTPTWQVDLGAGQQATWSTGPPRTRTLDDTSKVIAWREDRLNFDDQPLAQVVEELQRNTSIPIRIADPRLLSIHLTGELRVDEPHIRASVQWLGQRPEIEVKDNGHSLILTYRAQDSHLQGPP